MLLRALALATLLGCTGAIGDAGEEPSPSTPSTTAPVGTDKGLRLPRLSHLQWARTARAFLALPETPSLSLRPDVATDETFATDERGRIVDAALAGEYRHASDALADHVVDDSTAYARFVAEGESGAAEARLRKLLERAWARAYRRPLSAEEIERYVAIGLAAPGYAAAVDDDGRLRAALRSLVRVTLQSPHFVYRVELGEPGSEVASGGYRTRALTKLEYATRLSYALFDEPPDATMLAMDLSSEASVALLLEDPRALPTLLGFHRSLYGVDASRSMRKDSAKFPGMEAIGADAASEAERFLGDVVQTGGGLRELLLSRKTFVNLRLASIYGLPTDGLGDAFEPRELPSERAGILTRVSWTAHEADLVERSSILRGVYVTRKLFCTPISNPPAGAESEAPKPPPSLVSNRDRVSFRTSATKCRSCHETIINPSGFAFESFDAIGRHVTEENGAAIDASGTVLMDGVKTSFSGARSFLEAAAETKSAHECYVGNLATWMLGRPLSEVDRAAIVATAEHSRAERLSVRALVQHLVSSQSFRSIVVEEP